jgi:hypothetical protein
MTGAELAVVGGGVVAVAALAWLFFGPRTASGARVRAGGRPRRLVIVLGLTGAGVTASLGVLASPAGASAPAKPRPGTT